MKYQLKPCREEDREWGYALKSEAYRQVVERQFGPWDEEFQLGLFSTRWSPGISNLIFVDGALVGLLALEERGDEFWLDEIQLVREWRSRGIGSAIVHDLLDRARAARKMLRLQVLKENSRALVFYRRLGFYVTKETETHYVMQSGEVSISLKKEPNQASEPTAPSGRGSP